MDNPYISNAAQYLIDAVFGVYLLMVMLRFLLQLAKADFYNPISQFLVKVTNPPLRPLRRIIPGLWGIDLASVVLLFALQATALVLSHFIAGIAIHLPGLLVMTVGELLSLTLNCYMITILAQVILSWVGPAGRHPVVALLYTLNEPIMRPARRLLPPFSGLDLSPILVIIAIQLTKILVVAPIFDLSRAL